MSLPCAPIRDWFVATSPKKRSGQKDAVLIFLVKFGVFLRCYIATGLCFGLDHIQITSN